jgi:hypothetical protein
MVAAGCTGGRTGWSPPESAQAWDVPVQQVVDTMQRHGLNCAGLTLAELPPRNSRHAGICRLGGDSHVTLLGRLPGRDLDQIVTQVPHGAPQ